MLSLNRLAKTYPNGVCALDRVSLDYLLSDFDTVRRAVGAEKIAISGWSGTSTTSSSCSARATRSIARPSG